MGPCVYFATPIFHTHVNVVDGRIDLDLLDGAWTPSYSVRTVCETMRALLGKANPSTKADSEASRLCALNPSKYLDVAREWCQKHAHASDTVAWDHIPMYTLRSSIRSLS